MADSIITDPLGRTITLRDATWQGHIRKGHPEVSEFREFAEAAVERPLAILHSKSDEDCRLYFGKGPRPGVMIVVVADVTVSVVKTAYLARRRSGGAVEWPEPSTPSKA